jgi:hypothetical protein
MKLSERTYTGEFPPKSTLWTYYLSAFFYEAFFEFITLFVVLYVQLASPIASSGDPQLYQTMLMAIIFGLVGVKILTAVFYTLAGHALEGVVTKIGRYRLFILTGSAACSFFFILLFFVAPLLSGWYYVVFFLFFFILMEFCYTFNDIAFWAYLNTLTRDEKHKGIYSSFLNSFSLIGSYLVASLSPAIMAGEAKRNMTLMAAILIVCYPPKSAGDGLLHVGTERGCLHPAEGEDQSALSLEDSFQRQADRRHDLSFLPALHRPGSGDWQCLQLLLLRVRLWFLQGCRLPGTGAKRWVRLLLLHGLLRHRQCLQ